MNAKKIGLHPLPGSGDVEAKKEFYDEAKRNFQPNHQILPRLIFQDL